MMLPFGDPSDSASTVSGKLRVDATATISDTSTISHRIKSVVRHAGGRDVMVKSEPIGFQEFWDLYPRKEKKVDARKAWMSVTVQSSIQIPVLIEALKNQLEWNFHGRAYQYIPLPASWLRGERWNDELFRYVKPGAIPPCDRIPEIE